MISNDISQLTELENLSEEERKLVLNILEEYSNSGKSEKYDNLIYEDYEEIPITIEEFLHNPKYLGKGLINEEGKFTVFPYWENLLKEIFPDPLKPASVNTLALTGCLSYDTLIPLLNGKKVKIGDLAKQDNLDEYVYSYDVETNKFTPGHLVAAFSTGIKPVYKITLDNGESFKVTSNHKFMLRNKHWKSIDSGLSVGDSLMPFYRDYKPVTKNRNTLYEYIKHPQPDGTYVEEKTHVMSMRYKINKYKGVVHHKDFNPLNNDPRNLLKTDWTSHKYYHSLCSADRIKEFNYKRKNKLIPEELEQRMREGARRGSLNRWSNPAEHIKASILVSKRMKDEQAKKMLNYRWNGKFAQKQKELAAKRLAEANKNTENINKYQISKAIKVASLALKDCGKLTETSYNNTKLKYNMRSGYPNFSSVLKRIPVYELEKLATNYNHKIVSIEFIGKEEVFDLTVDRYHNFALECGIVAHNSIGIGKTLVAVITGLYELYRMLCLKDPYLHYGLQPIDKITFAFMNITMDAAKGVAWDKCQQLLQSSEWFMSKGNVSKGNNPTWSPPKGIELIYGSQSRHIIGRAVYWCFQDEVSFQQNIDVNKQKEKAKTLVNTASARMQSRFMKGEKNPTLLVLASSKRTEQSFMETFIEGKKKQDSKTIKIVDEPQWVIRTDKDSPNKFKVAIGNKFLSSEVLPLNYTEQDLQIARNRGYTLLDVPMGYYENFIDDIDIALTDIAGISTSSTNRYISGVRLANVKTDSYKNAFKKEIIEVGNAKEDTAQYKDFFDINLIPREIRSKPLYIHMDMSKSGDKTGIAGVFIKGKKPTPPGEPPSKDLFFTLGFSVSVKAPKGYEVSYEKNRNFIYWLREQGLNIKGISTDTFQSVDTGQQLSAKNFNYCVISVDRVDSDRICKPYQYLRSTIYEERIEMYNNDLLTDELIGLERDNNSGKLDHSPSGINSKDQADAVCGALWNASQHAEQFAFDYGETLETVTTINNSSNNYSQEQILIDLENEMKQAFSRPVKKDDDSNFINFGLGKAKPLTTQYLANGIALW